MARRTPMLGAMASRRSQRPRGGQSARETEAARSTSAAIARLAVNPGDSMPNRFIRPPTPCASGPCSMKSLGEAPGPCSFGRTPLYAGASAPSFSAGQ